jgi:hypothetical protein
MLFDDADYALPADCPQDGIYLASNATDSHIRDIVVKNVTRAGVYDIGSANTYARIHVYGYPNAGPDYRPQYGMYMSGGYASITQAYCDGFSVAGIYLGAKENAVSLSRFLFPITPNTLPAVQLADGIANTAVVGNIIDDRIGTAQMVQFLGPIGSGVTVNFNGKRDPFRTTTVANAVNYIDSTASATGNAVTMRAEGDDTNVSFDLYSKGTGSFGFNTSGGLQFRVENRTSAVNNFYTRGGPAGTPPAIVAEGSDTNIDVHMIPKGAGRVRFGVLTASADAAVTGYIEVRDSGGTTRRLAVIS